MINAEDLASTDIGTLVSQCIALDAELTKKKKELSVIKDQIQKRAQSDIDNKNMRYVKYYGKGGSVSVMDTRTLNIMNIDRLKGLISSGVWEQKVKESTETKYKFHALLERAIKAAFTGDYVNNMTLEDVIDDMLSYQNDIDGSVKRILMKKLKGDYIKDRAVIINTLHGGDDSVDVDTELWLIYKIKNWELIKIFFPEEGIDGTIAAVKQCVLVDIKTAMTLDYEQGAYDE